MEELKSLVKAGQWTAVVEALSKKWQTNTPTDVELLFRSIASFGLEDYFTAYEYGLKAYESNPNSYEIADFLSLLTLLSGRRKESYFYRKLITALEVDGEISSVLPDIVKADYSQTLFSLEEKPLFHKGLVHESKFEWDEAEHWYLQYISFEPLDKAGHFALARCQISQERYRSASESLKAAKSLFPEDGEISTLLGDVLLKLGEFDFADVCYRWAIDLDPLNDNYHARFLRSTAVNPHYTAKECFEKARDWGEKHVNKITSPIPVAQAGKRSQLKVGFIVDMYDRTRRTPDLASVLSWRNLEKFEFIGYGNGDTGELYNRHFKTAFDEWRDVSHSDPITLFNMIAADGIDILINMVGYSSLNSLRCMNSRMAPIQVLWAKEPYAGALPGVDYIVSDWLPSDLMEKKIEIEAGSVFCARHQGVEKKTVDRDDRLTFVADAAFVDLDPVTIALWAKVLLKFPESMLLLRSHDFFAEENSKTLIDRFSMMGIAHRVDILQEPSRLNFFQNGDLALLPSQGADAEVVYDAFDAGVPVFWAFEDAKKTSEAYTILNAFDATHQFVFETSEEMLSGIKAWLENEKAKTFHEDIQQQMKESLLMDPEGRMRKIENLLWNLWDKKCSD